MKSPRKSRAKTPNGNVAVDLPGRIPVTAEEIALLRAFLAREIDAILWPTPATGATQAFNAPPSADRQPTDQLPAAVAEDGSARGGAHL